MNTQRKLAEIVERLRQELPSLQLHYRVKNLEVFGSYARGEEQEGSDLDLLIEFSEIPGLFKYIELENHLSEILGVRVDLVMKDALKPSIGKRVLSEARPI